MYLTGFISASSFSWYSVKTTSEEKLSIILTAVGMANYRQLINRLGNDRDYPMGELDLIALPKHDNIHGLLAYI